MDSGTAGAHHERMSTIRNGLMLTLLVTAGACYQESAYAQGAPTADPQTMQGPPGGGMDPQYGYPEQGYQVPQDPNAQPGYYDGNAAQPGVDPYAQQQPVDPSAVDPNADPNAAGYDPNYGTEPVTDATIDSTLDGYGTWQDDDDYGRIWVPNATVVGADFTPYETCGSWAYSDAGWMFNCDYSWGWLPFHYGRWGWFDGYWGWVPGYTWGPAWVDWRYGGGYVGWRPMAPTWRDDGNWHVRDHRHQAQVMDSHWRFAAEGEMNKGLIRSHEFRNPAEGLRVTQPMRPPAPAGVRPVHSATMMQAHMPPRHPMGTGPRTAFNGQRPGGAPQRNWQAPQQPYRQPAFQQPNRGYQQAYRAPQQPYRQPAFQQPYRAPAYQQPYRAPAYQQPYRAPQSAYRPPMNTYRPPMNTYRPPTNTYRPSYSAPSRSYSAPSYHPSYSAPSHSYSAPSYHPSYSAPSHSSYSGGGGGGFHSSGGGGGGFPGGGGGGGHHR